MNSRTHSSAPSPSPSGHITIGTAGHIDHGKTELVKALTGTNPDRLKEEKERGITTDIGFAYLDLPSGIQCAIVDVPGHEDFIRNMLAGVGGIDLVLLIVAADEGVKPQTREHLDICRLLEIPRGIIVITKSDLADDELLHLVESDIRDLSKGTPLEAAPIVRTSARSGAGIGPLRSAIDEVARGLPLRACENDLFRLPIDRVFVMQGFGTVVTGTVASGSVRTGEEVELFSLQGSEPRRSPVRVRSLQSHKKTVTEAAAGQRVAVNLHGVRKEDVARGDLLAEASAFEPSNRMDVLLQTISPLPHPLRTQTQVAFHLRTFTTTARVLLHDRKQLSGGESALASLVLDRPATGVTGDRFVILGTAGYQRTIGGGQILDPAASHRRYREKARPLQQLVNSGPGEVLRSLLELHGQILPVQDLARRTGAHRAAIKAMLEIRAAQGRQAVPGAPRTAAEGAGQDIKLIPTGDLVVLQDAYDMISNRLYEYISGFHRQNPYEKGTSKEELRQHLGVPGPLFEVIVSAESAAGRIRLTEEKVSSAQFRLGTQSGDMDLRSRVLDLYRSAALAPPTLKEAEEAVGVAGLSRIHQLLENQGELIRVATDLRFHRESLEELKGKVSQFFHARSTMSPADLKDLAGVTRKHAIPILEYFDRIGLTRREGNVRKLHSATAKVK